MVSFVKKYYVVCSVVITFSLSILFSIQSCSKLDSPTFASSDNLNIDVTRFERNFIQSKCFYGTKSVSSENAVMLFGYSTVEYHGDDSVFVSKLWAHHRKELDALGGLFLQPGSARIYYSLANAIVTLNGKEYIADNNGVIRNFPKDSIRFMKLAGREATEHSKYTLFKSTYNIDSMYEDYSAAIYDMGIRKSCNRESQDRVEVLSDNENKPVSCMENHGGKNCTDAFNLYQGRCPIVHNRCMDYNGPGTDCSGSRLFFLGSDCCVALLQNKCWEEVM